MRPKPQRKLLKQPQSALAANWAILPPRPDHTGRTALQLASPNSGGHYLTMTVADTLIAALAAGGGMGGVAALISALRPTTPATQPSRRRRGSQATPPPPGVTVRHPGELSGAPSRPSSVLVAYPGHLRVPDLPAR